MSFGRIHYSELSSTFRGFRVFIENIKRGDIIEVKKSFKLDYLEMEDFRGIRPIHYACKHGNKSIVQFLLESKCNIEAPDKYDSRAIHYACEWKHDSIVQLLLENKCDIEAPDKFRSRPIHIATETDNEEIIRQILNRECQLEVYNHSGKYPIHYACKNGNKNIVSLLLLRRCNIEVGDNDHMLPIHYACKYNHIAVVKLLINAKCNIEVRTNIGWRPIHIACQNGNIEIAKLLIENQCDIDAPNIDGSKPLHIVCRHKYIDILKLLLQNHCNIESCEKDLIKIAKLCKCQDIIDLLSAATKNRSMSNIALAMGLKCNPRCSHKSCFISKSLDDLKKNELIGRGAFGDIFKGSQNHVEFAMKIIKIYASDNTCQEAKYLEKDINKYRNILQHERIVQYYGAILNSQQICIFMEYMAGGSIESKIKQHTSLSHAKVARYSKQILEGVAFLHEKKIIHRDIKPANILLSLDENIKLTDFGVSRFVQTITNFVTHSITNAVHSNRSSKLTTSCGTPNYMAPEVIIGEPYRFPADIWSMGATVVEMLTGNAPYHDLETFAVIFTIGTNKKIEYQPLEPISNEMKEFLDQMLHPIPDKRATAEMLLHCDFLKGL